MFQHFDEIPSGPLALETSRVARKWKTSFSLGFDCGWTTDGESGGWGSSVKTVLQKIIEHVSFITASASNIRTIIESRN